MRVRLFIAVGAIAVMAMPASAWNWEITSDFDVTNDLEGWTYPYLGLGNGVLSWQGVSGDGYMQITDRDGGWQEYAAAPAKFLGDWNSWQAEQISFDFRTDSSVSSPLWNYDLDIVVLSGTSANPLANIWYLSFETRSDFPPAMNQWATYHVSLDDPGWRREAGTQTLDQTFANVTGFVLEVGTNSDSFTNDFDNVKLQGTPELPPSALLGASMLPLALTYVRGRRRAMR